MPTFESIPLDPVLKQQLLNPPKDGVSISTPQALLSRTPQALADQLLLSQAAGAGAKRRKISNDEILKQMDILRSQVAHSMMAQTIMGKYRLQQQKLYDDGMVQQQQQQYYYDTETSTDPYDATRPLILGATVNAMQAWQQEQERNGPSTSLSTGCRAMDELLSLPPEYTNQLALKNHQEQCRGGMMGFPRGHLLCLSGSAGSGKSQWCLQLSAQALRDSRRRVRYCYSSAGHNGHALAQRLSQLLLPYQTVSPIRRSSSKTLERIEFQPMRTTTQLVATLKALEEELLLLSCDPLVLVVDSLSNLDVQGDSSQMTRLYRNLKRLARQYSLWVVIAQSTTNTSGDYHVECQSLMTTTTTVTTTTIQATVRKHPTRLEPSSVTLFHTPSGMSTRAS